MPKAVLFMVFKVLSQIPTVLFSKKNKPEKTKKQKNLRVTAFETEWHFTRTNRLRGTTPIWRKQNKKAMLDPSKHWCIVNALLLHPKA